MHRLLTQELGLQDAIETIQREQRANNTLEPNRLRRISQTVTQTALAPTRFNTQQQALGRTFPSMIPWFKLDRLYVRGFEIESAEVKWGQEWRNRSDHAPIQAILKLN